jgi:hypothetical protein
MKGAKPMSNSGKTYFQRVKKFGQSWVAARDAAIKNGTFAYDTQGKGKGK